MLAYTTYSEAGGTGKTTLAIHLAVAHARAGLDVLVIPLDPQDGNLSRSLGIDENRSNEDCDTLLHHLAGAGKRPFLDLTRTVEGVDVIPEHNNLSALDETLRADEAPDEEKHRLEAVLQKNGVAERYDIVICDPPATESLQLYNAICACKNLVIPVEPTEKGRWAIEGLEGLVNGLSRELSTVVGVIGTVPIAYKDTNAQADTLDALDYDTLGILRDRRSLFEGALKQQCSAFKFYEEHRSRQREYEGETLDKIEAIARRIEQAGNIDPVDPPEPRTDIEVNGVTH